MTPVDWPAFVEREQKAQTLIQLDGFYGIRFGPVLPAHGGIRPLGAERPWRRQGLLERLRRRL